MEWNENGKICLKEFNRLYGVFYAVPVVVLECERPDPKARL